MRWLFPLLIVVALVFGASHAAAIISAVMGPWSATGIEHDGSLTHMQFGRGLPRPAWVEVYPGARLLQIHWRKISEFPVPTPPPGKS